MQERAAAERAAVAEERSRIARELHDVIGHEVTVIALQADAAAAALAKAPERAAAPIEAIRRSPPRRWPRCAGSSACCAPPRRRTCAPSPGSPTSPALVEQSRAAGARVDLTLRPPARPTHASVELAAYRLVQEALTNARRHAPGAPVDVRVVGDDTEVVVEVVNRRDGAIPTPRPESSGFGLVGMRERVRLLGGRLDAGPDGRRRLRADRPAPARPPGGAVTTVVVVDDQQLVRDGLRLILELSGVDVLGEAADGREGVRLVLEHRPDVVLMDLRMPDMDGIEATRRIVAAGSPTRVLVLTTFEGEELTFRALQAGATATCSRTPGAPGWSPPSRPRPPARCRSLPRWSPGWSPPTCSGHPQRPLRATGSTR